MTDITKCHGQGCPLKGKCYSYRAKPSEHEQAYFSEVPYTNDTCEYFIRYWGDKKRDE